MNSRWGPRRGRERRAARPPGIRRQSLSRTSERGPRKGDLPAGRGVMTPGRVAAPMGTRIRPQLDLDGAHRGAHRVQVRERPWPGRGYRL
jgi:hypothetical protein